MNSQANGSFVKKQILEITMNAKSGDESNQLTWLLSELASSTLSSITETKFTLHQITILKCNECQSATHAKQMAVANIFDLETSGI